MGKVESHSDLPSQDQSRTPVWRQATQPMPISQRASAEGSVTGSGRPEPVVSRSRMGFRTVLRNRYFLRLWMAQLISQTIMNAANYGMIILIAIQSKSVFATGGAIAAFSLPAALFGAPAGVLVDRLDKRNVLWISNALRAVATFGFVLTLAVDSNALVPVYLLTFFIALVGQFFAPAEGAAIPLLVHDDELVNALALFNITFTLSQVLGLIVLGPVILAALPMLYVGQIFGHGVYVTQVESLFLLVAVLYCVCTMLILSIPRARLRSRNTGVHARPLRQEGEQLRGIWAGITECWAFIRQRPPLLAAVLQLSLAGTVIAVMAEIAPAFVRWFFALDATYAALVFIPAGVGLILGSVALPHMIKRVRNAWLVVSGVILLSVCAVLVTVVHFIAHYAQPDTWQRSPLYIGIVLALMFVMGLSLDLINIPAQATMQALSPDYIKGRVLALQGMLFNAATVPVVFLVGIAADRLGLPPAVNLLALAIFVLGFMTVMYSIRGRTARAARPAIVTQPGTVPGRLAGPSTSRPIQLNPGARPRRSARGPGGKRVPEPRE